MSLQRHGFRLSQITAVLFAIFFLTGRPFSIKAEEPISEVYLQPESKLWLVGDSTLHAYSATADKVIFDAGFKSPEEDLFQSIQKGEMNKLIVKVPVAGLKSGKTQLDQNMHKSLKEKTNPEIIFELSSYEFLSSTATETSLINAKGQLSIAGKTNPVEIQANVSKENGQANYATLIQGKKEVLMTDYGIKPPSFMGLMKTHNRVVVNFDLVLIQKLRK